MKSRLLIQGERCHFFQHPAELRTCRVKYARAAETGPGGIPVTKTVQTGTPIFANCSFDGPPVDGSYFRIR